MSARFEPAGPLRGTLVPPADKSISHRAALLAAMCEEPVTIRNFLQAEDTRATLDAIASLGAGVEPNGDDLIVRGVGLRTAQAATGGMLDVRNAGTLLRILPGWLAGQPGGWWTLTGDRSIMRRPVDRIVEPLRRMGARVQARDERLPPLTVHGTDLSGTEHELGVASAQVKSCLLIAGMLAEGETAVREPLQSRDHTERMLARARAPFERDGATLRIRQVDELELDALTVPGDVSSAAFAIAAAACVERSRIVVCDVGLNWTRTAFLRILARMGAVVLGDVEQPPDGEAAIAEEPAGEVDVAAAPLEGTAVEGEEVPLAIDELPLVALVGCFAEGETMVRGAAELRRKESDRIAAVVAGLSGLGADIEPLEDGFVVRGSGGLEGGTLDAGGDHRMAMLGAVAGLASRRGVEVVGMGAAAVSYPDFEGDLRGLVQR